MASCCRIVELLRIPDYLTPILDPRDLPFQFRPGINRVQIIRYWGRRRPLKRVQRRPQIKNPNQSNSLPARSPAFVRSCRAHSGSVRVPGATTVRAAVPPSIRRSNRRMVPSCRSVARCRRIIRFIPDSSDGKQKRRELKELISQCIMQP